MAVECGVIAGIFLLLALIYFRRGHIEWAIVTLPLMLLPLTNFVLDVVLIKMFKVQVSAFAAMLALVIAVAVSAAWIGTASNKLKTKHNNRTAVTFIGISNVFNIVLAAILINDILSRVEKLEAFIQ